MQFDYYEDGGWEEFGAGSELLNTTLTECMTQKMGILLCQSGSSTCIFYHIYLFLSQG